MSSTSPGQRNQFIAVYGTFEAARRVRDQLLGAGLSDADLEIRAANPEVKGPGYGPADHGFWEAIELFLVPADRRDYEEAVSRGHVMLLVRPAPDQRDRALQILHQSDPVDLDARVAEWRGGSSGQGAPASGAAAKTASDVPPSAGGADVTGIQAGAADPLASANARRQSIGRVRSYALDPPGTYAVPRMSGAPEEGGGGRSDSGGTG
jgi:hypothetical protein